MGDGDESYRHIDLLIVDHEEALRLSGCNDIPSSIAFFREKGAGAVLVTNGAKDVSLWADSPLFGKVEEQTMPVSAAVGEALKQGKKGDSTGCGDNFAGGVIGSLARQLDSTGNNNCQLSIVSLTLGRLVAGVSSRADLPASTMVAPIWSSRKVKSFPTCRSSTTSTSSRNRVANNTAL